MLRMRFMKNLQKGSKHFRKTRTTELARRVPASEGPWRAKKEDHLGYLSSFPLRNINQSRICGKGVGLSLFPSDSLSFESYEQFVKKSKNDCFFGQFRAKFGYVSHISAIRI